MNRTRIAAALLFLSQGLIATAAPTTLDFDVLVSGTSLQQNIDGFAVDTSGWSFVGNAENCGPSCAWNGTNYLLSTGGTFTIRSATGEAFGLSRFDAAEAHTGISWIWARQIHVVGLLDDGDQVVADFELDGINDSYGPLGDFQTFTLGAGFGRLSSVTFSGIGGDFNYYALDNIVLNGAPANDVPEPGSLALVALALLGASVAGRRKSR